TGMLRYLGDSTLLVDAASQSLTVIDGQGKFARVMSPPRARDVLWLSNPAFGVPGLDPQGRLIYRGILLPNFRMDGRGAGGMPSLPEPPDSAPIVRADFE